MDFSINGASLDLENIHSFIENGINGTPVSANVWYNPDDSISADSSGKVVSISR